MTLNGLAVFDTVPDFEQKIAVKYVSRQTAVESGKREVLFGDLKAQATLSFTYQTRAKTESLALVNFWESRCGAKQSFWCPSWKNQLGVIGAPRAGDTVLNIQSINYGQTFLSGPNPTFASGAYIFLYDFINPPQFHQVSSIVTQNGVDALTLGAPLAINFTSRRFIAGLCYLVRFDSDKLEETWMDENCVQAKLTMVETINYRPDAEPNVIPDASFILTFDHVCDDDVRIQRNGIDVQNLQRIISSYDPTWQTVPHPQVITYTGPCSYGDVFTIDTFDGWLSSYSKSTWTVVITYRIPQTTLTLTGGSNTGEIPSSPASPNDGMLLSNPAYLTTGPHFFDYHANGSFTI